MSTSELQQVRHRAQEVRAMIEEREQELRAQPNNFSAKLTLSSLRSHLEDLNRQAILLAAEADRELINFRLIGNQVTDGTIGLGLLAKLAGPLSDALTAIGVRLRYKEQEEPGSREKIQRLLDLRLVGLGEGSTRLYLTGNAAPDLAGDSLLEAAAQQLFALLNADHEEFFDSVHTMGPRAARATEALLKAMEAEELAAELSWTASDTQTYYWEGRTDRITQLRALLEQTEERQTELVELRGAISLVSDTTRLEIREDGKTRATKIRYRKDQLPLIANLTVGQRVNIEVEKTSFLDKSEQRVIEEYRLSRVL